MVKLTILIGLFLSSRLATAQEISQNRLLPGDYRAKAVEEAIATLTATNVVRARTQVEYKAGQSVVLQPGFEARTGAVFTAHTGPVRWPASAADELNSLTLRVYPNPFDAGTTITYGLGMPGRTRLHIRDVKGNLISQPVDGADQEAGLHSVAWSGDGVPAGTYVCILEAGSQRLSLRIIRK